MNNSIDQTSVADSQSDGSRVNLFARPLTFALTHAILPLFAIGATGFEVSVDEDMTSFGASGTLAIVLALAAVLLAIQWHRAVRSRDETRRSLRDAERSLEDERAKRQNDEAHLREIMALTVEGAIEKFKTASNEQLKANGAEFAQMSKQSLADILDPLKARIKEYDERVEQARRGNATLGTELKGYAQTLKDSAEKMHRDASGFRNELRFNNKFQGDFGEDRLELVLERCGFVKGDDFVMQSGEEKRIPDCRLYDHLGRKILVIDSKMSWKDYSSGFESDDAAVREAAIAAHVASVRKQIDNLAAKRYHATLAPDREGYAYLPFSVMFVPSDGALISAVERDASLIQYATGKSVYLTSPLNLHNFLRLVQSCRGDFDFSENLTKIALEARHVVERLDSMVEELESLGAELKKAAALHEKVMKRITEGSAENKSSVRESALKMIALGVRHEKLRSKTLAREITE